MVSLNPSYQIRPFLDAVQKGFKSMSTFNHSKNQAILALNQKLGFKSQIEVLKFYQLVS